MKLINIVEELNLVIKTGKDLLDRKVTGGYAGDLLSDVLSNGRKGDIWVTLQTHMNIVAIACSREFSGIIVVNGRNLEEGVLKKAEEEKIAIMKTELSTYGVVARLTELGIR